MSVTVSTFDWVLPGFHQNDGPCNNRWPVCALAQIADADQRLVAVQAEIWQGTREVADRGAERDDLQSAVSGAADGTMVQRSH